MSRFDSDEQYVEKLVKRLIATMIESGKFSVTDGDRLMDYTTLQDFGFLLKPLLEECLENKVILPLGIWQELYKEAGDRSDYDVLELLGDIAEYSGHPVPGIPKPTPDAVETAKEQPPQSDNKHPEQHPVQPAARQFAVHPAAHVIAVPPYGAPQLAQDAWVGPGAIVVGNVRIGSRSSIWYNAVVRGDSDSVEIGEGSNVQDLAAIHTQKDCPVRIGDGVSLGHGAVVHGAVIENNCLIGMNATVLSGAVVGEGSLVAAGAVVKEGMQVPPRSLVAGVPARVVRELDAAGYAAVVKNAERYLGYTLQHAAATGCLPGTGE